jgi:hypothetical protein
MIAVSRFVAVLLGAVVAGSFPAPAAQSPSQPGVTVTASTVQFDAAISHTSVTTLDIPRTDTPLGALTPIGRQPLYVVRVDANGRAQNFSTVPFPPKPAASYLHSSYIGLIQGAGNAAWVTFQTGTWPGGATRIARGRNGSLWIRLGDPRRWPGADGPTLAHVQPSGHITFFTKPAFLGDQFSMASTPAGDLWIFDAEHGRLIRVDERDRAFLVMQFEVTGDHRLGLDPRTQPSDAFWLSDRRDRLVFVPLDGSPVRQFQLQRPAHGVPVPWPPWTYGYDDNFYTDAGDAKGCWVSGGANVKQQRQWYGVDGTLLDIGEPYDESMLVLQTSTDPSTGNWMFQDPTIAQNDSQEAFERLFEVDTQGREHVTSMKVPPRDTGTPIARTPPHSNTYLGKLADRSYIWGWDNDTVARLDPSHHLRLTKLSF